jgi:hypothetical protein
MHYLERGAGMVIAAFVVVVGVLWWVANARCILRGNAMRLSLPELLVFFAPFFLGLCWLVGWITS